MNNKKAMELALNTIVIAVMVLIVMAIVLLVFNGLLKSPVKSISDASKSITLDHDCDGVPDAVDPCPCNNKVPATCTTNPMQDGCPGRPACPPVSTCETMKCTPTAPQSPGGTGVTGSTGGTSGG